MVTLLLLLLLKYYNNIVLLIIIMFVLNSGSSSKIMFELVIILWFKLYQNVGHNNSIILKVLTNKLLSVIIFFLNIKTLKKLNFIFITFFFQLIVKNPFSN